MVAREIRSTSTIEDNLFAANDQGILLDEPTARRRPAAVDPAAARRHRLRDRKARSALMIRVAATLLLLLAGCGGEPIGGPPEIQYGLEECGHCRMIISEERHAAAIFDQAGTATRFDDVGCMLEYLRPQSVIPKDAWVHDHATGAWIDAEPAWFVKDPRGSTPMGSGWMAFSSRSEADAHAAAQGLDVMAWASIRARPRR